MRITDNVIVNNYLSDLQNNLNNKEDAMRRLSTGQQVNRPSDDPFKTARSMELNASISENERYNTNIDEGMGWVKTIDSAMGSINDVLQSVRTKIEAGGNGGYSPTEKQALADYISQMKDELMDLSNSTYDGRYIFGGDKTNDKPVQKDGSGNMTYVGSKDGLKKIYGDGISIDVGAAKDNFGDPMMKFIGSGGIFDQVLSTLNAGGDPNSVLDNFDKAKDVLDTTRSEFGAKYNRLDDMKSKNEADNLNMTELLSKTIDVDVAKEYMNVNVLDNVYESSLKVGAKVLQESLLDYIR